MTGASPLHARWIPIALMAACGGGSNPAFDAAPDGAPCTTCPSAADQANRFEVTHQPIDSGYINLQGQLFAAVAPSPFTLDGTTGACRLYRHDPTACTPPCEFGTACAGGTCVTPPEGVDLGPVTIAGLASEAQVLNAQLGGAYLWSGAGQLGSTVALETTAFGGYDALALSAQPIGPAEPDHDWNAAMAARDAGADVTLRWRSPESSARIYLRMTTGIGTHGGTSPVEIECDAPDTGSLTLPGPFLNALYADGWSCGECGSNELYRYRAAIGDTGPAHLALVVRSPTSFYFHPNVSAR